MLTEPYAGYHGIVFDEQFGQAAFIMRARTEGLRDFGACLSPTNAFQLLQGVETLGVRMDRHIANTPAVLEFLTANKAVDWVLHPSLPDHPDHELAKTLLPRGAGSIVSFGIKGGRPAGKKFIEALRMISHLANVGDAKTLVIHPASTTHQQMDAAQLKAAGIGEELVRLSVGIESASDIIDDLGQALRTFAEGLSHATDRQRHRYIRRHRRPGIRPVAAGHRAAAWRRLRSHHWALHSRWFAHHGFGVLAPDLPGHGRSAGAPLRDHRRHGGLDCRAARCGRRDNGKAGRPFHGIADRAGNRGAAPGQGQRARA